MKIDIKLFADGADLNGIMELYGSGLVDGITTNPTLMKKAGIADYEKFANEVASRITDIPVSFEVLSDDFAEMERQARKIGGWGENVYIKIPVTNTRGESSAPLINKLSRDGYKLNVTAILTLEQVDAVLRALDPAAQAYVSVFAGRIADTGVDPCPIVRKAAAMCGKRSPNIKCLWASTRELLNIFQAQECGADIITVTHDILKKLPMIGRDHNELSLDTVKMFYSDAVSAGFVL
ncbi:MAG: transaldolase [Oscillospiraceae bacterium]|nr:transaldolase [Oscillospiraceae bacterium]